MSKKNKELEIAAVKNYLLPYLNLHKQHPLLPGAQTLVNQAAFIGISESELSAARKNYQKITKTAALDILKDEDIIDVINNLPFKDDQTIMVIGDSITDDLQGWFEIFRQVIEIGADTTGLRFINAAVYNSSSVDAMRHAYRTLSLHQPDWVIIALGSLDAQRLHGSTNRTMVSLAEFWENISTIESMAMQQTSNPIIWLTPPSVVSELMEDMPLFDGVVYEADLSQYREVIAGKNGFVVDPLGSRLGQPAEAWNFMPDGFHPSLTGNVTTVKTVIKALTAESPSA